MDDTDLIARVYALSSRASENYALNSISLSSFCVPSQNRQVQVQYGRADRKITEPPEEPGTSSSQNAGKTCIEVRLSKIPRSSHGILFGCGMNCDVVLPNFKGLSKAQFSLTFDDQGRFIVKDLGSLVGTEVLYNGQGAGKRRAFQWIIGGDDNAHTFENIHIRVHQDVQFHIIATKHAFLSKQYLDKVKRYRQGTATTGQLLTDLGIPLPPDTERPTGTHTPLATPIYLTREIGRGSLGVVTHYWNVSNGEEHALKQPTSRAIVDGTKWLAEADTLSKLSHDNIVKIFSFDLEPQPQLALEYIPEGSLDRQQNITVFECVSILCQVLSALKYLHGSSPQIVHRDIKPDNILVRKRTSDEIQVVLGDFGLHGRGDFLKTICGSEIYSPPEIWEMFVQKKPSAIYSPTVDIWSCGVVVYELLYGLPNYERYLPRPHQVAVSISSHNRHLTWCEWISHSIHERIGRAPVALNQLLASSMLRLSPGERDSAHDCYNRATALANEMPRPATVQNQNLLFHQDTPDSGQTTIRLEPRASEQCGSNHQAADQSLPRSPSPLQSTYPKAGTNLKRPNIEGAATTRSPNSKRQTRGLDSLPPGSPGTDLWDAHPDAEAAVATVMWQLSRDVQQNDNSPTVPSWQRWNSVGNAPYSWKCLPECHDSCDEADEADETNRAEDGRTHQGRSED